MKRTMLLLLITIAMLSLSACTSPTTNTNNDTEPETIAEDTTNDTEYAKESGTLMEYAKANKMDIIDLAIGDTFIGDTLNLTVKGVTEEQTLTAEYSTPITAQSGTKFIVINMDVINTLNTSFSFNPGTILIDNVGREFATFGDTIGNIDDYLDWRDLSPSITETGYLVYNIPSDATNYNLAIQKASTNELYLVTLK